MFYDRLPSSTPDAIFTIAALANSAGPEGINGSIGIFMDEDGQPVILPSVRQALPELQRLLLTRSYNYPKLLGLPEYRTAVLRLLDGDPNTTAAIATTGGTGAVAINLRLAARMTTNPTLLLPSPAWANHPPLCKAAGLTTIEVPYLSEGRPTVEPLVAAVHTATGPTILLLQVGCHNPTGLDWTDEQWQYLIDTIAGRDCIALLDLAYQGFARGVDQDRQIIHRFVAAGITTLVAWSASKNHSIYSERTGMAAAFTPDERTRSEVEAHYSNITRGMHSAAATLGQSIVAITQMQHAEAWQEDLAECRSVLQAKRDVLRRHLPPSCQSCIDGYGMFAMLPLTREQIHTLQTDHRVFMTYDGRVNIAGIPLRRMEEFAAKIGRVCAR